jgi:hypothetical protein
MNIQEIKIVLDWAQSKLKIAEGARETKPEEYAECAERVKKVKTAFDKECQMWITANCVKAIDLPESTINHIELISDLKKGIDILGAGYYYKDGEKDGYRDIAQRDGFGRIVGWMTVKTGTGVY